MQCLTPSQCSEWLRDRGIIESPWSNEAAREACYLQFAPPKVPGKLTAFIRALFGSFGEFPGALVFFTDWSLYQADEMALMNTIRRSGGEQGPLIETPGHLFAATQQAEAIAQCYLAMMFGWSACLYLASGTATVLLWEGDLVDVWSAPDMQQPLGELVQSYDLQITHHRES